MTVNFNVLIRGQRLGFRIKFTVQALQVFIVMQRENFYYHLEGAVKLKVH